MWWQQPLLQGVYTSIDAMAAAEAINSTCISWVMHLACLVCEITEAILEGKHLAHLAAKELPAAHPLYWAAQRVHFKRACSPTAGSAPT